MMRSSPPKVIGLTGDSGSGKSTVAKLLAAYGGFIVDADELSHEVIKRGQPAYIDITTRFGTDICAADGEIDRKKLGRIVFNDRDQLAFLEKVIHPRVCEQTLSVLQSFRQDELRGAFVVIDAPLLIEAGIHVYCGSVWVVTAASGLRETRVAERDGLSPLETARRVRGRRDNNKLLPYADIVIKNDGDMEALTAQVDEALRKTAACLDFVYCYRERLL